MPEEDSDSGSKFPLNINSLLAILTIVGGVWLVSHKLSSDRPVATAGVTPSFPGDQTLAARLWEDPFKSAEADGGGETETNLETLVKNFEMLVGQVREKSEGANHVFLLPVMLEGGQYSENHESRIRSRYAIVSALGTSGFAPNDAEHLGALTIPWPTSHEVIGLKNTDCPLSNFWNNANEPNFNASANMQLRYEWYLQQTAHQSNGNAECSTNVLVLWLDDSYFEDEPLIRLPLVFEPLLGANSNIQASLIGPRRSATLRAMLPGPLSGTKSLSEATNKCLQAIVTNILGRVDVYSATASAMDEVLVTNRNDEFRDAVSSEMHKNGFKCFHNFAATDTQLSSEIFDELANDGTDLTDRQNHVVLISEWDTFYGQMQSLTYAAVLAAEQAGSNQYVRALHAGRLTYAAISDEQKQKNLRNSVADFVSDWMAGRHNTPTNFHSFVYLRGLDGQTTGPGGEAKDEEIPETGDKESPATIDALLRWTPDANKAEGQAQFDYLSRLGDQLVELQQQLTLSGRGEIKAVGIVGSDVYDTLLILQALHPKLPDVVFFTTDLDARFLNPQEKAWARELLVVSGYGLRLGSKLQGGIPAFRESEQTAQFAAALAALGNTNLGHLKSVCPRLFEVGNNVAMDWSKSNLLLGGTGESGVWLHPRTPSELKGHPVVRKELIAILVAAFLILLGLARFWPPLRRMTFGRFDYLTEPLNYTEEDFGEASGVDLLRIKDNSCTNTEDKSAWFLHMLVEQLVVANDKKKPVQIASDLANQAVREIELYKPAGDKAEAGTKSKLCKRVEARQSFDGFLDRIMEDGKSARRAAMEMFTLRRKRLIFFWALEIVTMFVSAVLAYCIWRDKFGVPTGEPFSLTNGVSAWPGEIIRLLAASMAIYFCGELYFLMREAYFVLTRQFRLKIPDSKIPDSKTKPFWAKFNEQVFFYFRSWPTVGPGTQVDVSTLWEGHYENGRFWWRIVRILLPVLIYGLSLYFIVHVLLGDAFFLSVRGNVCKWWDFGLTLIANGGFIVLALLTIDSAVVTRQVVFSLGQQSVKYPDPTSNHFKHEEPNINESFRNDWISLQLIVEVTEHVGKLVYYPTAVLLLLLFARNGWWDNWTFPPVHILVFVFNLLLSLASVFILQRTAKSLKTNVETKLAAEVKRLRVETAGSDVKKRATADEQLLEEVQNMRRGAFVPFWENPVLTALFASSGGITILQLVIWFLGKNQS